jgi:hypothetical protein
MSSLLEFFQHDFQGHCLDKTIVFSCETLENRVARNLGEIIEIRQRVIEDSLNLTRLFTFYVPENPANLLVCKSLIFELEKLKWEVEALEMTETFQDDHPGIKFEDLYSKSIFIYAELPLTALEYTELDKICRSMGLMLTFRSTGYVKSKIATTGAFAFITHDLKDKDSIARPVAQGLFFRHCYAAYEGYSVGSGAGLQESIMKGIQTSMRCILVISADFLDHQADSKKEFNSIYTREKIYNERAVFPIWSNVSKEQVYAFSPALAETFALIWPTRNEKMEDEYQQEIQVLISRLHIQISCIDGTHRYH